MSRKSKGINAERELLHLFWKNGWACIRVAGSGASRYPTPDILAGNGRRILAVECKCIAGTHQYFEKEDVQKLQDFATRFGAEPWLAVRFSNTQWRFYRPDALPETENSRVVSRETAAIPLEQLIA